MRTAALVVFCSLSLASCLGAVSVADLPPGDWYDPTVVNDTTHTVTVRHCTDERCSDALHQEVVAVIGAGRSEAVHQANARGGDVFAIDDHGSLAGCLPAPGDATGDIGHVELRVSTAGECRPSYPATPKWLFVDLAVLAVSLVAVAVLGIQQARMNRRDTMAAAAKPPT